MSLGESLRGARKKCGLSQEDAAEKLGISRQTVSKWETDETLPDLCQAQKLAALYQVSLDELTEFDAEVSGLKQMIRNTSEETQQKVDWNALWAEQYPVLASYRQEVKTEEYVRQLNQMLEQLKREYGYHDLDAFLVLKDILGGIWTDKSKQE